MDEQSLAYYGNRVVRPPAEPRRAAIKRAISATLVALVHLVLLATFTLQFIQERRAGHKGAIETILDLSLLRSPNAPPVVLILPQYRPNAPPQVSTAPVTIPPIQPPPQDQNAPAAPGDVLKAIGEALSCGASNFENLTDQQRARCRHQPWLGRKLPDGTIVLEAPPKQAQPEFQLSGADQMRRDMAAPKPCPIVVQIPCVDDIIHGRSSKPF